MEEDENHKMIPELSVEAREDKMTKMAVMQRELERLKEELQAQTQWGRKFSIESLQWWEQPAWIIYVNK